MGWCRITDGIPLGYTFLLEFLRGAPITQSSPCNWRPPILIYQVYLTGSYSIYVEGSPLTSPKPNPPWARNLQPIPPGPASSFTQWSPQPKQNIPSKKMSWGYVKVLRQMIPSESSRVIKPKWNNPNSMSQVRVFHANISKQTIPRQRSPSAALR